MSSSPVVQSSVAPAASAAPAPVQPGVWQAPAAELTAALARPVWCDLSPELGVIRATGSGAVAFLQTQLTNDVAGLDAARVQLNGYCTAKGRLQAVFDNWRDGEEVFLQLPRSLTEALRKRLSMFILRAPAKLLDASDEWVTLALLGPGSAALLRQAVGAAPEAGQSQRVDALRITHLADGQRGRERFVLRAPVAERDRVLAELAAATRVDSGVFWWSQIDAAIPNVWPATQEAFVPQMINLEVLGGVNFKKGCYPGQEVVARSQYLGKLRRRMGLAHAADGSAQAGSDVFADGQDEPIGQVIMAAAAPGGGLDLLYERAIDRLAGATLRLTPGGTPLQLRELPYPIVDVTA